MYPSNPLLSVYMRSGSGPAALRIVLSFFVGVSGIESVNPSPSIVSHDEDEVEVEVVFGVYEGEVPDVVPLVVVVVPELRPESKTMATMPMIKTTAPPMIQGRGLRFAGA